MSRFQINGRIPFYYWFFAGILVGVLIGWMFSGFINMLFRMLLFGGVIVVIGLAIYLWGKVSRTNDRPARQNDIPDGNWRTIDPSGRK